MNGNIIHGCRMSCDVFEKTFLPSFRNFSFAQAFKIAERVLSCQNTEVITLKLVRDYNSKQLIEKQPIKVKEYISKNYQAAAIEGMLDNLIDLSRNPSRYQSKPCDAAIDVFVHKNMIYTAILSEFVQDYKLSKNVEDFSFSTENIGSDPNWNVKKEIWQKLYKNGRMRLNIIDLQNGLGIQEIRDHFANPTKNKKEIIDCENTANEQAA